MSFTCPVCAMTSHNPNDEEHGYCGNCNAFTNPPRPTNWCPYHDGGFYMRCTCE